MIRGAMVYSNVILLDYLKRKQGDRESVTLRMQTIADETTMPFPTVQRGLKRLEQSGAITRERQTAFTYTYRVMKDKEPHGNRTTA